MIMKPTPPIDVKNTLHQLRRVTFIYITLLSSLVFLPLIYLFLHVTHNLYPNATNIDHSLPHNIAAQVPDIRIRSGYTSYQTYLQRQLNKTLNPKLREVWTTRDWDRKIQVFAEFFSRLKQDHLLSNASRALCIGARVGQEVAALRRVGVDLVPWLPLNPKQNSHSYTHEKTFEFRWPVVVFFSSPQTPWTDTILRMLLQATRLPHRNHTPKHPLHLYLRYLLEGFISFQNQFLDPLLCHGDLVFVSLITTHLVFLLKKATSKHVVVCFGIPEPELAKQEHIACLHYYKGYIDLAKRKLSSQI